MGSKKKKLLRSAKDRRRGGVNTGTTFIVVFLVLITAIGFMLIGGQLPSDNPGATGSQVVILKPTPQIAKNNLQLYTFLGITVTPTPPKPTGSANSGAQQSQCNDGSINEEPENFEAADPQSPSFASSTGQLKVWVTDENTPYIAPNEVVDNATGRITTPGNRTATDGKGHIIEPRIYIAPDNVASNQHPYYPDIVKGDYSAYNGGSQGPGPAMDPLPPKNTGSVGVDDEYVWNVSSLGLAPGTYSAQVIIHDGDDDQGAGCFTIVIQ